jgi:hypothetical protein
VHARRPVTRVGAGHLVVRTEIEAADGTELAPLEVRVPIAQADLLDPTATPGVAPLVMVAAARGEDLHVEGPVDALMAIGAPRIMATLVDWWSLPPLTVRVDDVYDSPADGDAVGLLFSGGIDSWSTLLDLLDEPPGDRVTHLVSVRHVSSITSAAQAEIVADVCPFAAELGLEVVEVASSAQALLSTHHRGIDTAALASRSPGGCTAWCWPPTTRFTTTPASGSIRT